MVAKVIWGIVNKYNILMMLVFQYNVKQGEI